MENKKILIVKIVLGEINMSKTIRHRKDYTYKDKDGPCFKKSKDKKFFGFPEDNWARLGGRWGKKRSYGHFAGMSPGYPKHLADLKKNPPPPFDED
jgi:hypothetical protein